MIDWFLGESTTEKHGKHNQLVHGNRYGKNANLTLERARALRKSGDLQKYTKRARDKAGTKPAKERNQSKPKKAKPADIASKVENRYKYQRTYPVGKAQSIVLDKLGIKADNASHASDIFDELGIAVSSKRVGRSSVPVVIKKSSGGSYGMSVTGDYGDYVPPKWENIDLSAISEYISD